MDDEAKLLAIYERVDTLIKTAHNVIASAKKNIDLQSVAAKSQSAEMSSISLAEIKKITDYSAKKTRELDSICNSARRVFWGLSIGGVIVFTAFTIVGYLTYGVQTTKYKTYWENEKKALFGARVVENDGGTFVVFDKNFVVGGCNTNHCVSIKKTPTLEVMSGNQ